MAKLAKYEIEAVSRQILEKIREGRDAMDEGAVSEEYIKEYKGKCEELIDCQNKASELNDRITDIRDKLGISSYQTYDIVELERVKRNDIRAVMRPKIDSRKIEDLVIVHANLALKDIVEIVTELMTPKDEKC